MRLAPSARRRPNRPISRGAASSAMTVASIRVAVARPAPVVPAPAGPFATAYIGTTVSSR
jgi:hypothetical protein